MTRDDLRKALDDLCDADAEERKAREAVREAGRVLGEASARRDALAARIAPILKANRGRTCKGKAWNRLMRKFDDRAIYIDEHGCVAVEPMVEAWDMAIPAEEGAKSPDATLHASPNSLAVDLPDTLGLSDDIPFDDDPCIKSAASLTPQGA